MTDMPFDPCDRGRGKTADEMFRELGYNKTNGRSYVNAKGTISICPVGKVLFIDDCGRAAVPFKEILACARAIEEMEGNKWL